MKKFVISFLILLISIPLSFWLIKILLINQPSSQNSLVPERGVQSFTIQDGQNNSLINVPAATLPQFIINLAAQKFSNIFTVQAAELPTVIDAKIQNVAEPSVNIDPTYSLDSEKKQLIIKPKDTLNFKPGKYKLSLKLRTLEGMVHIDQDFTWGVLAVNTDKSIYRPGETVKLGMGVLDDQGKTHCLSGFSSAKVWLTITSPSGKETQLSTDDGSIKDSGQCGPITVTNTADFLAQYQTQEAGIYQMHVEAQTQNGQRAIDDYFKVEDTIPFDVTRYNFPTRIYPHYPYSVNFEITAHQNFNGTVEDVVPSSFKILEISGGGRVEQSGDFQKIVWHTSLNNGDSETFGYRIQFPDISPEFYLLGPIKLTDSSNQVVFTEARQWQIASDAISFVQTANAISSGGASTTASPTLGAAATAGDLLILSCGSNSAVTWTTPSGFTLIRHDSPGADQAIFYKIAAGGETTATCTQSTAESLAATLMEYSSIENNPNVIPPVDTSNFASGCSPHTGSITTTQPDELLFVALLNTKSTTYSAQTGYTQRTTYQDTGGAANSRLTTSLGDNIVTSTGTYSASATSNGGNCIGQIVGFRANIDVSLAGFRFFANANSLTPGSPIAANNSPVNLTSANQAFRLRIALSSANYQSAASMRTYKLQEAPITSGSCGTYVDVTSSTDIAFNDNTGTGVTDGATAVAVTGDPRYEGASNTMETYEEANNFTNSVAAIPANGVGIFDFSLKDNTTQGTGVLGYCFQLLDVTGGNTYQLDSYPLTPEVFTQPKNAVIIQGGTTIQGGTQILP